jgi:predicted dehydrogenase
MIKVAVLGAGMMGQTHIQRYAANDQCRVEYVFDGNPGKAELAGAKYGVRPTQDLTEILNGGIDIVDICLPTFAHKDYCLKAAARGMHVLCEKPMAMNGEECAEMIDCAKANGVKLMIAHVLRFWPEYTFIKELIETNRLGRLLYIRSGRRQPLPAWTEGDWMVNPALSLGGVVDLQIHDLDLLTWLLGRPRVIKSVGNKSRQGGYEQVTTAMEHVHGSVSIAEACNLMPPKYPFTARVLAAFENGSLEYDSNARETVRLYVGDKEAEYPPFTGADGYQNEIDYFVDCVKNDRPVECAAPEDAMYSLWLALKSRESLETGKEIVLEY